MTQEETARALIDLFSGYHVGEASATRIVSENAAVRQGLDSCARSLADAPPADLEIVFDRAAPK